MVRPTPRSSLACPQALRHVVAGRDVCGEREHEKYVTWIWLVKRVLLRILNGMVQTEMVPDYSSQAEGGYDLLHTARGLLGEFRPCAESPRGVAQPPPMCAASPPPPHRATPRHAAPRHAAPRRAAPLHAWAPPRSALRLLSSAQRRCLGLV